MDAQQINSQFGLPDAQVADETQEQREARLRAQARRELQAESDAAMLARFKLEERVALDPVALDTQGFPAEYVKVEIFRGQNKFDPEYVPLGINGFVIKAPRGEPLIIPRVFLACLENAVEEVTIKSQGGLITRPAHRFPYMVRGDASIGEYKAFQAEQRAKLNQQKAAVAATAQA